MSIFSLGRSDQDPAAHRPWTWPFARQSQPVSSTSTSWWRWNPYRTAPAATVVDTGRLEARSRRNGYIDGQRDQARLDARLARRHRHPVLTLIVFLAALAAAGFGGLAFETGSFTAAGETVDQTLSDWRADLMGQAGQAVDRSGQAVQSAGETISAKSKSISRPGG